MRAMGLPSAGQALPKFEFSPIALSRGDAEGDVPVGDESEEKDKHGPMFESKSWNGWKCSYAKIPNVELVFPQQILPKVMRKYQGMKQFLVEVATAQRSKPMQVLKDRKLESNQIIAV